MEEQTTEGFRSGIVMAGVNDSGTTAFTDLSTPDGSSTTENIVFSTAVVNSDLILRATNSNNTDWNVKVGVEIVF